MVQGLVLLFGVFLSIATRKAPSYANESKLIAISVCLVFHSTLATSVGSMGGYIITNETACHCCRLARPPPADLQSHLYRHRWHHGVLHLAIHLAVSRLDHPDTRNLVRIRLNALLSVLAKDLVCRHCQSMPKTRKQQCYWVVRLGERSSVSCFSEHLVMAAALLPLPLPLPLALLLPLFSYLYILFIGVKVQSTSLA